MPQSSPCPVVIGRRAVLEECGDLLRDESSLTGRAVDRVYRPRSGEEAAAVVRMAAKEGARLTVSGARTGIAGGAVPGTDEGGPMHWLLSLERMDRILGWKRDAVGGLPTVRVQAGVPLSRLTQAIREEGGLPEPPSGGRWMYPVDPTEWTASAGGTIATNASGARSYRYGPTAPWVRALRVVLADGTLLEVGRGEVQAQNGRLVWPGAFGDRVLTVPSLPTPRVRCVAGYALSPEVDLIDLLVGSEGTLAVVVEAELALTPEPRGVLSLFSFLPPGGDALALTARIRSDPRLDPLAIEYLDGSALELLRRRERTSGSSRTPVPSEAGSALFVELPWNDEAEMFELAEAMEAQLSSEGGSLESTWAGDDEMEARKMKALRHAVPEAVNERISTHARRVPGLHKVGTDLAVPDQGAAEMNGIYRERLRDSGMEYALFGHAAENHLHANLIPSSKEELDRARSLHLDLAREAVRLGGSVTAEHGIGRLKHELVPIQYGEAGVDALRGVKRFFDPEDRLNPGVIFPARP
jgi:D-lactate dehydrogenase (cytochrome)